MALCLAGAIGATFMTRDATRRPILAATPATVAGSAPTSRRRRPLAAWLISVASALWVSGFTLVVGASPGGHGQGDNMADRMTDHAATHTGLSGGRLIAVWVGLGVLVAAQLWDLVGHRRCQAIVKTPR